MISLGHTDNIAAFHFLPTSILGSYVVQQAWHMGRCDYFRVQLPPVTGTAGLWHNNHIAERFPRLRITSTAPLKLHVQSLEHTPANPKIQHDYIPAELSDGEDIEYLRAISDVTSHSHSSVSSHCLQSLQAPISPPLRAVDRKAPSKKLRIQTENDEEDSLQQRSYESPLAPVPRSKVIDPIDEPDPVHALAKYLSSLERYCLSFTPLGESTPRISVDAFTELFYNNLNSRGHHYVIHQHDHPQAGLHYDLRLQFSETSTVSWAVPKGLPCNGDSKTKRRLAVETRVHPYWYNTVEGGSAWSGTTLVWDCGVYEMIEKKKVDPRLRRQLTPKREGESQSAEEDEKEESNLADQRSQPEKLMEAFQRGSITITLKGTRLRSSTFSMRLRDGESWNLPPTPNKSSPRPETNGSPHTSSSLRDPSYGSIDFEQSLESDIQTFRFTNAYPHSSNTINSVPQRTWFMFRREESQDSFIVWGKEFERSVVTGRRALEIQHDLEEKDGVTGMKNYRGRRGWTGICD
ncbi:DNA polymerase ligase-domain-containing protein [Kalaharituber pfeilii]|nr:DNA polymerase ligase-domain-containing protein [Kalaharituber pfeilii]